MRRKEGVDAMVVDSTAEVGKLRVMCVYERTAVSEFPQLTAMFVIDAHVWPCPRRPVGRSSGTSKRKLDLIFDILRFHQHDSSYRRHTSGRKKKGTVSSTVSICVSGAWSLDSSKLRGQNARTREEGLEGD